MIAIFTLLGLVLFGGGLYAIYDGWPYLVLERGFTEVIIGSIAAATGLLLLSLAWVLKELKAVRRSLAEAAEARASAPVEAAMPAMRGQAVAGEAIAPPSIMPVAVGAGAIGVGAAAVAAAVTETPEPAAADSEAPAHDLFGAPIAEDIATPDTAESDQDEAPEPVRDEAVPDMFEGESVEPMPSGAEEASLGEPEDDEDALVAEGEVELSEQGEASADLDEATETAAEEAGAGEAGTDDDAAGAEAQPSDAQASDRDEFAVLRESLTSQLGGLYPPAGRIEPSLAAEEDPFAEAEARITLPGERREPSFGDALPATKGEAGPPVPAWPPRTEPQDTGAAVPDEPDAADESAAAPDEADADHAVDEPGSADDGEPGEPQGSEDESPASDAKEQAPAAKEPAASEEGIVGAYQVGETHFTIYADGSIRARTPDGEYSFASMDELKVYLASEKSRLGV